MPLLEVYLGISIIAKEEYLGYKFDLKLHRIVLYLHLTGQVSPNQMSF